MSEAPENAKGPMLQVTAQEAEEVVRRLGLVFSNTYLYGPAHSVTKKAVQDAFAYVGSLLSTRSEIMFTASEEGIAVNGTAVELKNPLLKGFATRLEELGVSGFAILSGIGEEEFGKLVELLNAKPDEVKQAGGFAQVVSALEMSHVRCRVVTYRAVTEDEVVVSKKVIEETGKSAEAAAEALISFLSGGASDAGAQAGQGGGEAGGGGQAGEGGAGSEKGAASVADDLARLVDRPSDLSDVVMKAAQAEAERVGALAEGGGAEGEPGKSGEPADTVDILVRCLRRVYDVLSKHPIARTQKGRRNLAKTLAKLEEEILARLNAGTSAGEAGQRAKTITEAVAAMREELEVEALASEYMKKRRAVEENEKRLLKYLKSKGLDKADGTELRARLAAEGLSDEEWRELLARSGSRLREELGEGFGTAEGHLAILLSHMQQVAGGKGGGGGAEGGTPAGEEQMEKLVAAVNDEIRDLVSKTEQKINALIEAIRAEEEEEKKASQSGENAGQEKDGQQRMSRRKLLAMLAEIVQELCQPLAVIGCSIDMIRSKHLGEVTDSQMEMLNLASSSGERVRTIVNRLMEISGLPKELSPDTDIQASLYRGE